MTNALSKKSLLILLGGVALVAAEFEGEFSHFAYRHKKWIQNRGVVSWMPFSALRAATRWRLLPGHAARRFPPRCVTGLFRRAQRSCNSLTMFGMRLRRHRKKRLIKIWATNCSRVFVKAKSLLSVRLTAGQASLTTSSHASAHARRAKLGPDVRRLVEC